MRRSHAFALFASILAPHACSAGLSSVKYQENTQHFRWEFTWNGVLEKDTLQPEKAELWQRPTVSMKSVGGQFKFNIGVWHDSEHHTGGPNGVDAPEGEYFEASMMLTKGAENYVDLLFSENDTYWKVFQVYVTHNSTNGPHADRYTLFYETTGWEDGISFALVGEHLHERPLGYDPIPVPKVPGAPTGAALALAGLAARRRRR